MGFNEGFLLVYAINSYESFNELRGLYQDISAVKGKDGFAVVLVGNKSDLEDQRTVPVEGRFQHQMIRRCRSQMGFTLINFTDAKALAAEIGCPYFEATMADSACPIFEVSARSKHNVDEAVCEAVREVRKKRQKALAMPPSNTQNRAKERKKNTCQCCMLM